MKVWIVCVLLCAAFTLRTATAAAIETEPVQDQLLLGEQAVEELNDTVEDKEEALKVDAAAEAAAIETEPVQDQLLLGEQAVEELNDTVEDKEEALKVDAAAEVKLGYCPPGWLKYESRCFRLMRSGLSWLNAEAQCVTEGARLASVRNAGEHRFLQSFLEMSGLSQAWIGAYNFQGTWLWADTARFYYTNWYSLSSVSSYPCAYMRNTVGWSNTNCGSGYAYFCAIDLNSCSRT